MTSMSDTAIALRYGTSRKLRILMTGGTGFIGRPLAAALGLAGHDLLILSRGGSPPAEEASGQARFVRDLQQLGCDEHIDCIINLAGEPLARGRWNAERKARFLSSRLQVTDQLLQLVQRLEHKPEVLLNASAVGYYGHQQDQPLDEGASARDCFSHQLCARWEERAGAFEPLGLRVCLLRIGVVLGRDGGPLAELRRPFDWGVATQLGNGRQWLPWIHLQDVLDICAFALGQPQLQGAINLTAPEPVTQAAFSRALRRQITHPCIPLPVPAWLLRLLVGEMADEILLSGQRVVPQKLLQHGYVFRYPTLPQALTDLTSTTSDATT